ncbi:MAG: hypothetical protein F6K10_07975 [Moorea sp. SIO2B7]|nr:hypothetical protein [Moorena sp. SIO2B7]
MSYILQDLRSRRLRRLGKPLTRLASFARQDDSPRILAPEQGQCYIGKSARSLIAQEKKSCKLN